MSAKKERLTVTVDKQVLAAANAAVAAGRASSVSAWVNLALMERAAKDQQLAAMAAVIAEYEAEHGVITREEMAAQARADRRSAIIVRGKRSRRGTRRPTAP